MASLPQSIFQVVMITYLKWLYINVILFFIEEDGILFYVLFFKHISGQLWTPYVGKDDLTFLTYLQTQLQILGLQTCTTPAQKLQLHTHTHSKTHVNTLPPLTSYLTYIYVCVCIPKYNLLSLCNVTHFYVFRADSLTLDNQLASWDALPWGRPLLYSQA